MLFLYFGDLMIILHQVMISGEMSVVGAGISGNLALIVLTGWPLRHVKLALLSIKWLCKAANVIMEFCKNQLVISIQVQLTLINYVEPKTTTVNLTLEC